MAVVEDHVVPSHTPPVRLVDYLPGIFSQLPSRAGLKKAMKRGEVLVDGKPAAQSDFVQPGQKISLLETSVPTAKIFEFSLEIVYQDEWLAIINKPAGLPVSGNRYRTVQNALPFNLPLSSAKDALKWPRPVHRLDAPTSGLLLVARTAGALMKLGQQLEQREIAKRYRAIVAGKLAGNGKLTQTIQNRKAITRYEVIQVVPSLKTGWITLVDLFPETGRTHQLRIHLAEAGYPIIGDGLYTGEAPLLKGKGLFLAAVELTFSHPEKGSQLSCKIDMPAKFEALMEREQLRWKKYREQGS